VTHNRRRDAPIIRVGSNLAVDDRTRQADSRRNPEHNQTILRLVSAVVASAHEADDQVASVAKQWQEDKTHDDLTCLDRAEILEREEVRQCK